MLWYFFLHAVITIMLFSDAPDWLIVAFLIVSLFIKRKLIENLENFIETFQHETALDERFVWSLFVLPVISSLITLYILLIFADRKLVFSLVALELFFGCVILSYRFTLQTRFVQSQLRYMISLVNVVLSVNVFITLR